MWKRFLKIVAIISWPLAILSSVPGWGNGAGDIAVLILEILFNGLDAKIDGPPVNPYEDDWQYRQLEELSAYWANLRQINWRGRQIEEVVSCLGPFDCGRCRDGEPCKAYKDAVTVYTWYIPSFQDEGRIKPRQACYITLTVNDKGKIIAQDIEGDDCPTEAPDKPSAKEKPNKSLCPNAIWNWDVTLTYKYSYRARDAYRSSFKTNPPRVFDEVVESWMGRRMDELVRAWGQPTRSWVIDHTNREQWKREWNRVWKEDFLGNWKKDGKRVWKQGEIPDGVVKLNRWLILDHTWPKLEKELDDPAKRRRYWNNLLQSRECYTAFGADKEGRIIWAGRKDPVKEGEKGYFPLNTGYACELLIADGVWSPKKAPAKP
jgi:hypothetical protein